MHQDDLLRAAEEAPELEVLVVLSMPEGTIVADWSRASFDSEGLANRMASFLRAGQLVARLAGQRRPPRSTWLDTEEGAVVVAPLDGQRAAGCVFAENIPLGLARVQVEAVVRLLRESVGEETQSLPTARPEPLPSPPSPLPPPAAPSVTREERPHIPPTPVSRTPHPRSPSSVEDSRPRAVRLLEFLRRYAPDPHVTMLRLSLRTGIALEQLDRPEELDVSQVDQLAASVRDIIGQEQLGI